jgi:hypothetical protein
MPPQPRKRHARNHNSNMHRHEVRSQYIVGNSPSCLHLSPNLWFTTQCCYGASVDALVRSMHFANFTCWGQHGPCTMASLEEVLVLEPLQGRKGVAEIRSFLRGASGSWET